MKFNWTTIAVFGLFLAAYVALRATHNEIPKFILDPLVVGGSVVLAMLDRAAASKIAVLCVGVTLTACGSSPPPEAIDVGMYTTEQIACIEREDTDRCHEDRDACRVRIDACRQDVKRRYGR